MGTPESVEVLPAHAGMIRRLGKAIMSLQSAPRSRGDDPNDQTNPVTNEMCSPLTRG